MTAHPVTLEQLEAMSEMPPPEIVAPLMRDLVKQFPIGGWQHEPAIRAAIAAGWQACHRHLNERREISMSGPHGTAHPPAILINWDDARGSWSATAIVAEGPIELRGKSTALGSNPASALQQLLEKRFCAMADAMFPATLVAIDHLELVADREPIAAAG